MATKTYGFTEQLQQGQASEKELSNFFSRNGYDVVDCQEAQEMQKQGIDAVFTVKKTGATFPVEYKTDTLTQKTGNIFIETVSVWYPDDHFPTKEGWIHTSKAKFLIYAAVGCGILVVSFDNLREGFKEWESACREGTSRNKEYVTKGILVPFSDVEEYASAVIPWSRYLDK